jgi:hypothetical protein
MDAAGTTLFRFLRQSSQSSRIGIVSLRPFAEDGPRRQGAHVLVAAVFQHAHAQRPEHGLGRVAHEARGLGAFVAVAVPAPRRDMDGVPGFPRVAHAVDLGPARAFDDEQLRVPGVAMDGGARPGVDLVHQRIQAARGGVAVRAHVDAGAHAAGGRLQRHVLLADHRAPVAPPVLEELGAALLLDVVMRDGGGGFGAHAVLRRVSICGTVFRPRHFTIE